MKIDMQNSEEYIWFEVNSQTINRHLFWKKRSDKMQEKTRQLILEAFKEVNKNPWKYGISFKTVYSKKSWNNVTVDQLKYVATQLGDHIANWIEQALEWAQRINDGESWEKICNQPDPFDSYRLIIWKNGHARIVGGVNYNQNVIPQSDIFEKDFYPDSKCSRTIPLIISYNV